MFLWTRRTQFIRTCKNFFTQFQTLLFQNRKNRRTIPQKKILLQNVCLDMYGTVSAILPNIFSSMSKIGRKNGFLRNQKPRKDMQIALMTSLPKRFCSGSEKMFKHTGSLRNPFSWRRSSGLVECSFNKHAEKNSHKSS